MIDHDLNVTINILNAIIRNISDGTVDYGGSRCKTCS